MSSFDPRLTPAREDLAAEFLRGQVTAARFVAGEPACVAWVAAPIRFRPDAAATLESEALMGETFTVYERKEGFAWGQLQTDGYVGYVPEAALCPPGPEPTHRVAALRTPIYPRADIKAPARALISMNARVPVVGTEGPFAALADGGVIIARHLAPLGRPEPDFVAVAARFAGTPYLWGGRTSLGLDCSALVQLALLAAGHACPRDSDMMEGVVGEPVPLGEVPLGLRRGDILFWRGHIAIVARPDTLLHANAHHMETVAEPLAPALARIAGLAGPVTSVRRLA